MNRIRKSLLAVCFVISGVAMASPLKAHVDSNCGCTHCNCTDCHCSGSHCGCPECDGE